MSPNVQCRWEGHKCWDSRSTWLGLSVELERHHVLCKSWNQIVESFPLVFYCVLASFSIFHFDVAFVLSSFSLIWLLLKNWLWLGTESAILCFVMLNLSCVCFCEQLRLVSIDFSLIWHILSNLTYLPEYAMFNAYPKFAAIVCVLDTFHLLIYRKIFNRTPLPLDCHPF